VNRVIFNLGVSFLAALTVARSHAAAESIRIDTVLLTPVEEVEVPAQEAGILDHVAVSEGADVERGVLIAQLDDADACLDRGQAELELQEARRKSESDIKIRVAKKGAAVAEAELQRALDSQDRYAKSVSETEVDRLRLTAEHAQLQVEQAQYDFETAGLAYKLAENRLAQAERSIERRKVIAPVSGRVVQFSRRAGEWVEPGQTVARILAIDRLKAVGFLDASQLAKDLTGHPVRLRVELPAEGVVEFRGKIQFVHSEVNPVSGQVDFWAEIDNHHRKLRPGLRGEMIIDAGPDNARSAESAP
jgi:macrolide-specific efflux system membrane fusion protein